MLLYSSPVGAEGGSRIHVEFLRIPKPSGFSYRISMKAVYGNYPFFERGKKIIILTLLVALAYAGDLIDLIEDCGKYEAKQNSSHNSDWNSLRIPLPTAYLTKFLPENTKVK